MNWTQHFSTTLGAFFLLIVGAGAWSVEGWLNHRPAKRDGRKA